ncbi:DUF6344 domain-containing protein [Streptomyces sp. NPDC032940]|uniref:DUF6344 domain-containing protein n=1 Tax=Streptomyces sp. NPDC032940 TaxID=3155366 RepID=UPI0033D62F19
MARNKVMKLWTAIVTAFLALCTALGFATSTASAAVPQTETHSNTETAPAPADPAAAAAPWSWSRAGALPPTMKQRIHAEAHGKAPSCRHRPLADAASAVTTLPCDTAEPPAEQHTVPLQR